MGKSLVLFTFYVHAANHSSSFELLPSSGSCPSPKLVAYCTAYCTVAGLSNGIVSVAPAATPMRRFREFSGVAVIAPDA